MIALVLAAAVLILAAVAAATQAVSSPPGGPVVEFSGPVVLDGPVAYPAGTHVRFLPGTTLTAGPASAPGFAPEITVEGSLSIIGTSGAPIRFNIPLTVRTAGPEAPIIEHAIFSSETGQACNLALATPAATLRSVTVQGGTAGLCVGPPIDSSITGEEPVARIGSSGPAGKPLEVGNPLAQHRPDPFHPPPAFRVAQESEVFPLSHLPTTAPDGVVIENLHVVGSGVGVRLAAESPLVSISNSTIAGNDVGVLSEGGKARLDHVTLDGNRAWDIQAQREGDVRWTGTHVEASCAKLESSTVRVCERGSISQTPLLWLLGIALLATEAGRSSLVSLALWLRLYRRIDKEELLDHPARAELVELVTENPGMHFRELEREVPGVGRTRRHLRRLEDEGLLTSRRDGRYLRFYPPDQASNGDTEVPTRLQIQDVVDARPGIHVSRVAEELDLSRQLVSWHVQRLHKSGRLKRRRDERKVRLYPADPE